jgi:hypothetical protein
MQTKERNISINDPINPKGVIQLIWAVRKIKTQFQNFQKILLPGKQCYTVQESMILAGNLLARCKVLALNPMSRVRT